MGVRHREMGLFAVRVLSCRRTLAGRCRGGDRRRADSLAACGSTRRGGSGRRSCFSSSIRFWRSFSCAARLGLVCRLSIHSCGGAFSFRLLTAVVGIVFSLPFGVLLALGRRSPLPAVRMASVVFIEFVRGVPFITILFMANNLLPLFVPETWTPDRFVASIGRHRHILGRLYGGGGARRSSVFGERTIRSSDGAWTELCAHDGSRHTASGADLGDTGHRQQFHWLVHGHNAHFSRWCDRFPRSDEQCDQRSGLGGANDHGDGLRLRRHLLFLFFASEWRATRLTSSEFSPKGASDVELFGRLRSRSGRCNPLYRRPQMVRDAFMYCGTST